MDTYHLNLSESELIALKGSLGITIHQLDKLSNSFESQLDDCPTPSHYRILLNTSIEARQSLDNMRSILSKVEDLSHE